MFCFHFLVFMKNLNKQKFQHFNKELVSHVSRFCSVKLKIKIYTCCSFIWVFFFFVGVFFCTLHSTLVSSSRFPVYASLLFWHSCVSCPVCFILLPLCHHVYLYWLFPLPPLSLCVFQSSVSLCLSVFICVMSLEFSSLIMFMFLKSSPSSPSIGNSLVFSFVRLCHLLLYFFTSRLAFC